MKNKMLIVIESSYQEKLIRKGVDKNVLSALDDIFKLCYRSRLFFKADLKFYSFLYQKCKKSFSLDARSFLAFVIEKYPIIMSEIKDVEPLLILDENGNKELSSYASVCTIDTLPIDYTPYLFCENIEDTHFYMNVFKAIIGNKNDIYIKEDAYGGGNLAIVEHRIKQEGILLCICDSDKKYPDDGYGNTADKMIDVFMSTSHRFSNYYILNVREIENLIPYRFLQSTGVIKDSEVIKLIEILDKCSDDTINYFDVKSGYDKRTRKKYSGDIKWVRVNKRVIDAMKRNHMYHSSAGESKLIKGLGDNVIKVINNEPFRKEHFSIMKTAEQTADIANILNQIKRFGFAYNYSLT